jgi:hypothetical protein
MIFFLSETRQPFRTLSHFSCKMWSGFVASLMSLALFVVKKTLAVTFIMLVAGTQSL